MNRVREFREEAKISQVELARRVRIACTNMSAIERGRVAPWPKARRALARALKVPETELFPTEEKHQ
jgi:transcriptional regulator with XRE-family HTH domain